MARNLGVHSRESSISFRKAAGLGAACAQGVLDNDSDGIPDAWEINYGLDALDQAMAIWLCLPV